MSLFARLPLLGLAAAASVPALAEDPGVAFFRGEVRPILEENCFKCHGGTDSRGEVKVRGGLQLISRKGLLLGGDHGPAIDLENPDASLLLKVLSYEDEDLEMPPRGKLPDGEIAAIRKWIGMGAPWTPEDANRLVEVHDPLAGVTEVNETTLNHWSYRPMERGEVPQVEDAGWGAHPVDAFIFHGLAGKGLQPAPEADRATLLRRLSYDLTGLPPTLAEIERFVADPAPDAWEREIERLLASPHYGVKWARHWLDVVRYAESNGFERDADKPQVWRYRDWVIDAFNKDKPYDRFLMEQLAGDELPDRDAESITATGFHRLMQWDDEPADKEQYEFDVIDDNVRVITEGFMAMTVGCARCHDHKGDPIPQSDYYRFVSFLRGITPMERGKASVVMVEAPTGERSPADEQELERRKREVREKLSRIEERAMKLSANKPEGAAAGTKFLVTDARREPWRWHYTTKAPPEDWSSVGFRAELAGWKEGLAGFGTEVPGARGKTRWDGPEIWLQTTFGLEEIPKRAVLHVYHDEALELYLNGRPVLELDGYSRAYLRIEASEEFIGALQTGRNVIAARVWQTGGGQFFDLGIEAGGMAMDELVPLAGLPPDQVREYEKLRQTLAGLEGDAARRQMPVLAVKERPEVPPTRVHIRGSVHAPGDEVTPGFPLIWGGGDAVIEKPEGVESSGRRLALAKWLARPDHPRTARVMVNRIWQHHFGRGLSPTPNDFGFLGMAPTHPELLDWLATEFVRRGWSVKEMHRLLLTSRAYRMASSSHEPAAAKDPANDGFWRGNPRRLTAEEIRDSILAATGQLNLQMGGPSVYPELPAEVLATSSTKGAKWGKSPPDQANRRSIFVKVKRSLMPSIFTDFDFNDVDNSCPVRFTTTVPTQALAMLHSDFTNDSARVLAERLRRECPGDSRAQVMRAFELLLSRPASPSEIERSLAFMEALRRDHDLDEATALDRFCLAALNLNEFVFVD
ncbi:PSD1 and planctomycete cytochrome C domain-containing protein [Haloferula sp. A504]|uniref:PSD1 and planctomycete cytochrome C domain-containing protein n=1 Tax=Haloferula sp. A504 TaxID=3373601 RepID=UPI0031C377A0|nr:PSD1 and planctomycete cytochrome C domain-containing protein [Verrucomicrobiaceae bacterium E54]